MSVATALRVAAAVAGFLVLPGLAWTYLLGDDVDRVERAVLAVGLSVATLVAALYGLHLLVGQPMTLATGAAVAAVLTLVPAGAAAWRRRSGAP